LRTDRVRLYATDDIESLRNAWPSRSCWTFFSNGKRTASRRQSGETHH